MDSVERVFKENFVNKINISKDRILGLLLIVGFIATPLPSFSKEATVTDAPMTSLEEEERPNPERPPIKPEDIKIELNLARKWKKEDKSIKELFREASINRVFIQYFRVGEPPTNIIIGRDVPAYIGRLAIEAAILLNGGVHTLLPEFRFFPHYIAFGSSAYDEQAEIPIMPEELDKLRDPKLTTEEFHTYYRSITGEDKELPTY
jgi:hypothetical protein